MLLLFDSALSGNLLALLALKLSHSEKKKVGSKIDVCKYEIYAYFIYI